MKRLKDRHARKLLILQGEKVVSSVMTFYFKENDFGVLRYAIYGNRRLGGAVTRNRIKRLFREILNLSRLGLQGHDLIIIPRTGVLKMDGAEVRPYVLKQLLDNGILRGSL